VTIRINKAPFKNLQNWPQKKGAEKKQRNTKNKAGEILGHAKAGMPRPAVRHKPEAGEA
jgi:hypothetical protein